MSNYLVTGGAGFIGSNLAIALIKQGHSVRVLDNFSTGKKQNLESVVDQIELVTGDLTHFDDVREAVKDIDIVLHHGAIPSVPKSVADPLGSNKANVDGTLHILLASRDARVQRVIFASSSSIYGDTNPSLSKTESLAPRPISPYGVAKLAAEKYCQVFYHVYGLETVALRYFNVFGPRQDPESMYAAVIPRFIRALLQSQPPQIYGNGEQTRDFTFIDNVITGNMLAATASKEKVAGEVFNLAAGGQTSLNQLIEILQELMSVTIMPEYQPARQGDILHSTADIEKARSQMDYEPRISLLEGLRKTIEWYRAQNSND